MKQRTMAWVILAITVGSLILSTPYLNTCGDDSFIYFRLIERFLDTGHLEYNPGEPCYAMTSVTFFFALAGLVRLLGMDGGRYAISLIGHGLAVVSLFGLGRRLIRRKAVLTVVLAAILIDPFYQRWLWAGWEMSFKIGAAALALWALMAAGERRSFSSCFLAGLAVAFAVLTRPEMLFLAGLGGIYLFARRWPNRVSVLLFSLTAYALGLALLLAPWMTFAKLYFGWALPHTVYAKAGGICSIKYLQAYLPKLMQILFIPALPVFLLAAGAAWACRSRRCWGKCLTPDWIPDVRDFLLVATLAASVAAYLLRGVYIDGIKLGLFSPFILLTAGTVLDTSLRLREKSWSPLQATLWIGLLLAISVGIQAKLYYRFSSWHPRYAHGDDARFIEFANRVKDLTPPDARIGIAELGVVGYFSGRYMIDYVGLSTPEIVSYMMETGSKKKAVELYYDRHGGPADYIVHEFRFNPESIPATNEFWGYSYRLVDSEQVTRIAGRARKGEYSIYALYELIPGP